MKVEGILFSIKLNSPQSREELNPFIKQIKELSLRYYNPLDTGGISVIPEPLYGDAIQSINISISNNEKTREAFKEMISFLISSKLKISSAIIDTISIPLNDYVEQRILKQYQEKNENGIIIYKYSLILQEQ